MRLLSTSRADSKRLCRRDTSSSWSIKLDRRESWRLENMNAAERVYSNSKLHYVCIRRRITLEDASCSWLLLKWEAIFLFRFWDLYNQDLSKINNLMNKIMKLLFLLQLTNVF